MGALGDRTPADAKIQELCDKVKTAINSQYIFDNIVQMALLQAYTFFRLKALLK